MSEGALTPDEAHELKWVQWVLPLVGVLSIAAGVIILAKPADSLVTLAVIAGIFVLVDGALELFASLSRRTENRGVLGALGVLTVVIGVLLIRHPVGGVTAVALLLGIWLIAVGVIRFVAAFDAWSHRFWRAALGVLEVAAGIVIVAVPNIGYATLAVIAGISFIANGAGLIMLGWAIHGLAKEAAPPSIEPRPAT
jgi:uncharacterized membrane protein HdeD (DUF308 family)